MMSLISQTRRTVGFDPPTITPPISDSDSDDSNEDELKTTLKKATQLTTKHRLKKMLGDALQLDRRNKAILKELEADKVQQKRTRWSKVRSSSRKEIILPKMAELVSTLCDKPIVKFRRMARAVLLLIQVCHIVKDVLADHVKKEPWYALIDNLIAKTTIQHKRKAPRAFVTFVPNERRQLVQLTFDVAEFNRDRRTEFILTDEIREMLSVLPGYRTPQQVAEIIRVMKVLFSTFSHYRLFTQKAIGQLAFYDKYKANRVIVKRGHQPDGVFFILSGCVVEKHEGGKQPKLINAGEKFGELDLLCGNRRRHTILTKVDSEILYLHRLDYRDIFDLSDDRNNPKNLDICKQHIVFQHFAMNRLVENPGTWSVNSYKYGELIAKDMNNIDWIYVIKSGEARVLKYLEPDNIDVKARRRKVQAMINNQSPFYLKKRILNFVEDREYIKSAYRPATYHPSPNRLSARSAPPTSFRRGQATPQPSRASLSVPNSRQGCRQISSRKPSLAQPDKPEVTLPRLVLDNEVGHDGKDAKVKDKAESGECPGVIQETIETLPDSQSTHFVPKMHCGESDVIPEESSEHSTSDLKSYGDGVGEGAGPDRGGKGGVGGRWEGGEGRAGRGKRTDLSKLGSDLPGKRFIERRMSIDMQGGLFEKSGSRRQSIFAPQERVSPMAFMAGRKASVVSQSDPGRRRGRSASFIKTPNPSTSRSSADRDRMIHVGKHMLPAFVQVETLHPGQVFGLRACLDPEERGPSVSLVSGDCEVLQINKKFFMRHCDDAIYSLIRLKNKPFPSEEELIDRLDINMQWEEFKQQTLQNFLKECNSAR